MAELAEFNENIPLDDGGEQEEVEELSKAEQEIAALVEQVNINSTVLSVIESWLDRIERVLNICIICVKQKIILINYQYQ